MKIEKNGLLPRDDKLDRRAEKERVNEYRRSI